MVDCKETYLLILEINLCWLRCNSLIAGADNGSWNSWGRLLLMEEAGGEAVGVGGE